MKDIRGYEGLYAITEDGEIWSYRRERFLNLYTDSKGYKRINLYNKGKRKDFRVHRLVLETYNPVIGMEKLQVNHIDENKSNNNLSNLEWTTARQNTIYSLHKRDGIRGGATPVEQYTKEGELINIFQSQAAAARETGVNRYCISDCVRGYKHTAGGYIWRYHNGTN